MMPFPNEETTPPVTKMYFVSIKTNVFMDCKGIFFLAGKHADTLFFHLHFGQN